LTDTGPVEQVVAVKNGSIRLGDRILDLSSPRIMGILNVTPDSFSDGGTLRLEGESGVFRVSVDRALRRAEAMMEEGAAIIDVGGESTRPGAPVISEQEEQDRVLPVLEAIVSRLDVAVSVDTSTPSVIAASIAMGVGLVNDIRALGRAGALALLRDNHVAVCLMHMQGEPATMQHGIAYTDVVTEVYEFLQQRVLICEAAGIARERLLLDPGFGFGKQPAHNLRLLRELSRFAGLDVPLLVGLSRKSMLGAITGRPIDQRLAAGVAATVYALINGAAIIRTHDVAATADTIKVHQAVRERL
jgi:dihydropteroate synthase